MQMIIAHIVQILLIKVRTLSLPLKTFGKSISLSELSALGFEAVLIKLIQVIVGKPALLIQG